MELPFNFLIILCTTILSAPLLLLLLHGRRKSDPHRMPPSPPGWPVFGHMFSLGAMPHQTLAGLRQQYGPVVCLKLGSVNTLAILTAKAAAELFKSNDHSFLDRRVTETMRSHNFHEGSLTIAPYGAHWRLLRRICTFQLFTAKRINETATIRQKCVSHMISWIEKEVISRREARGVYVGWYAFLASFNIVGNLVLSRDLAGPDSEMGSEFFEAMLGIVEMAGRPNVSDIFPWLRWFDLQGLRKEMDRHMGKALEICSGFVKERLKEREKGGEMKNDFLDVLLDFEGSGNNEPPKLSDQDINILIMEMFIAGSETTSTTVEWVLTELLCNPEIMIKVKAELDNVVGPNRKFVESDIDNVYYLQAVVKESMRLHPLLPFLVPRSAIQDTNFMGYHIPKNTQVFVNTWAIGRDAEYWEDPLTFKPERFLGSSDIDYKGQHFEFIPFGAGRRICPGIPLGSRMVPLVLGSLLSEFDWELDNHITIETMDMNEKLGTTARKLVPLIAIPKKSTKSNYEESLLFLEGLLVLNK